MVEFIEAPWVERNPNERAPLVAIVRFKASTPVTTEIAIDDGRKRRTITFGETYNPQKGLPIIGMKADTEHQITVIGRKDSTEAGPASLFYRTPSLPQGTADFPRIRVLKSNPDQMEPGYTILSVRRRPVTRPIWLTPRQFEFQRDWGMLLAIDAEGEVVWTYTSNSRIAGVHRLQNGHLFFHHVDFRSVEIDLCGNVVNQFHAANRPWGEVENSVAIPAASLHHQPYEMPNGNYLALTANVREIDDYYTSETNPVAPRQVQPVVGDNIVEFTATGEIVWNWNSFDYLDTDRFGYQLLEPYWHTRGFPKHLDWTHGNGVTYDPHDDSILVSFRHQDAIVKIDRHSKEIKWILGDHKGWKGRLKEKLLRPAHDLRWHYHGHNPRVTGTDSFVMYDNGIFRAIPYDPPAPPHRCYARAVEYEINTDKMEVREVWASSDDDSTGNVISWAMGDAHRLPKTDNMLVIDSTCTPMGENLNPTVKRSDLTWHEWRRDEWHPSDFPSWARVREMKRNPGRDVVYEVHLDHEHDLVGWEVFGGLRTETFYPPDVSVTG